MISVSRVIKSIALTSKFAVPVHYSNNQVRGNHLCYKLSFGKEIVFPWFGNILANSLNQLTNLQNTELKSYT